MNKRANGFTKAMAVITWISSSIFISLDTVCAVV
ncbi:hypothetical protein HNQ42_000803 [Rummeliibacillus stabekisii]|nr:hypothetical protein [Rummeliibacillus stabekisii]